MSKRAHLTHQNTVKTVETANAVANGFKRAVMEMDRRVNARLEEMQRIEREKIEKKRREAEEIEREREETYQKKLKGKPFNLSTSRRNIMMNMSKIKNNLFTEPMSNVAFERLLNEK